MKIGLNEIFLFFIVLKLFDMETAVILITCWFEGIEVGFMLFRGSAIREFLSDENRFGPYCIPYFRRVDTLNSLRRVFGKYEKSCDWKFLDDLFERNSNDFPFVGMCMVSAFSSTISEFEYENMKLSIKNYVNTHPVDNNNPATNICVLMERGRHMNMKELEVL